MDVSQEVLKECCEYDPLTGVFTRIKVLTPRQARRVGLPCGTLNTCSGYVTLHVGRRAQYAHRLAWIYVNGAIPAGARIDHRDLNRSNNRIANLRLSTHAENLQNCGMRSNNTSGVKGVSYDKSRGRWIACVGKRKIGRFDTLFDAACARKSVALKAHGEFARES